MNDGATAMNTVDFGGGSIKCFFFASVNEKDIWESKIPDCLMKRTERRRRKERSKAYQGFRNPGTERGEAAGFLWLLAFSCAPAASPECESRSEITSFTDY